ncbi:MAG: hypothetical protein ACFFDT_18920, partial [Candidatus Hodarchaeota archaeon]
MITESGERESHIDEAIVFLVILLLLLSVILSFFKQLNLFNLVFGDSFHYVTQGLLTETDIILSAFLLLPVVLCIFFIIYAYLRVLQLNSPFFAKYIPAMGMAFLISILTIIILFFSQEFILVILLFYLVIIIYALKNYVFFTSREIPDTVEWLLKFNIPIIKRSFSLFLPYKRAILFVIALFIISKTFVFQFGYFFATIVVLAEEVFEIIRPLFDSLVSFLTPINEFFLHLANLIDLSMYQSFLDSLYFLERLMTKTIIYVFILDWSRITAISSRESSKIRDITKSGLILSNLREISIIQSINYLSAISILTVLMFEFLFIFVDLAVGFDL